MRPCILIFFLSLFGCEKQASKNQTIEKVQANSCSEYPRIVDSLQIRALYDSARWFVYTWNCDENYLPKANASRTITFGELPLTLGSINIKNDTLEISLDFLDDGKPVLPSMTRDFKELITGVGFDLRSKRKIYMLSPSGFSSTVEGGNSRYENPLQSGVVVYIKSNWSKLNSCFRELAERKGVKF